MCKNQYDNVIAIKKKITFKFSQNKRLSHFCLGGDWVANAKYKLPIRIIRKLIKIILETSNLVRKYTHICSFKKYTFQYYGLSNFADVSICFCKKVSIFLSKQYLYSKQQYEGHVRGFLVLLPVFVRYKVTFN